MKLTEKSPEVFKSKHRDFPPFVFDAVMINQETYGLFLEQKKYTEQIEKLPKDFDFVPFRASSHRLTSINQTTPEILAGVNILSQVRSDIFQEKYKSYKWNKKTCTK